MNRLAALAFSAFAITLVSGCATGVKGSPRRLCYEAGVQPGTPEFSTCWRNVARSQGTVVFDDPEAVALIGGAIAAGVAAKTAEGSRLPSSSRATDPTQVSTVRQYLATRKEQDIYDLVGGPLVVTNFCYVYAYSAKVAITGNKLIFLNEARSCDIRQINSR